MKLSIIFLILLVIISILGVVVMAIYNKFQDSIIKINEVEGKIDESLRKKFDILIEMNNIIKETIKTKKELIDDLEKLRNRNISSFEMDRKLIKGFQKISFVKKQYSELQSNEKIGKLFYDIEEIDEELNAFRKYYNENIVEYNILVKKVPYSIVGLIFKYKEKSFFDGKDLTDENIKDFKL